MDRRFFLLAVSILIALSPLSSPAKGRIVVTFEDLPDLIGSQNRHVLAGRELAAAEKARTGHLARSFLPHVQVYGGGETFQTGDFERMTQPVGGAEGRINLFRGGRDLLEAKARKSQADVSKAASERRSRDELLRARKLFAEILFLRERIADLKEAISLARKSADQVRKRIEAGLTTETDRLEFEMSRRQFEQELALAKEDYEHGLDALRIALNLPNDAGDLDVRGALSHFHDSDLESAPLNTSEHPEVQEFANQKKASELKKKQSNRWWTPSVDVYGGYNLYPFRERERPTWQGRDEAVLGGRITFEIFDGLNSKSEASAQAHRAAAFGQEADQRREELGGMFRKLKHELKTRHEVIHLIERNLSEGRRYYSLSSEEYERGVKNSRDMLASLQRYSEQEESHSRALMDYLVVKSELLALLGL